MKKIEIYDTTLRDGTQGEGISSLDIIQRLLTDVKPSADGKATR